jgi:hypothetical protein
LNLRRVGEIHLFRESSIPEQGILFDGAVPIDEWKYPDDGKRVREKYADETRHSDNNDLLPPLVLSKNGIPGPPRGTSNSFYTPSNTGKVTKYRRPHYGERQPTITSLRPNSQGPGNTDRLHDWGISEDPSMHVRNRRGYAMPAIVNMPRNIEGYKGLTQLENTIDPT